jgi:hypothetical protein
VLKGHWTNTEYMNIISVVHVSDNMTAAGVLPLGSKYMEVNVIQLTKRYNFCMNCY